MAPSCRYVFFQQVNGSLSFTAHVSGVTLRASDNKLKKEKKKAPTALKVLFALSVGEHICDPPSSLLHMCVIFH